MDAIRNNLSLQVLKKIQESIIDKGTQVEIISKVDQFVSQIKTDPSKEEMDKTDQMALALNEVIDNAIVDPEQKDNLLQLVSQLAWYVSLYVENPKNILSEAIQSSVGE